MPLPRNQRMTPLAALLPLLLCAVFGANTTAIKISLTGLGKFTAAGLRFAIAALAIAIWAGATGRRFRVPRHGRIPLLAVSLLFTVQLSLFYLGVSRTLASRAALVVNVVPFLVLIFAHVFIPNDRINGRKIIGMLMGFSGVALVLFDFNPIRTGLYSGDFIVLTAATVWAANAVYTKTIIEGYPAFHMVFYPMICAAPVLFAAGWIWDDPMVSLLNGPVIAALLYQSLVCAAVGFVVWNTLLQRYGASTLHSFIFIMPIAGVSAGTLMLQEPITGHMIAAVVLVASGIVLVNFRRRPVTPTLPVGRSY